MCLKDYISEPKELCFRHGDSPLAPKENKSNNFRQQ